MNNSLQRLVMFDLDGTLLDSNGIWFDKKLDNIVFKKVNFKITDKIIEKLMNEKNFPLALENLIKEFNIKTTTNEILKLYEKCASNEYKKVKFKVGAFEYLKYLKNNKIKIVITTSCFRLCINTFLKENELENFFDWIITTKELGIYKDKDKPDIYLEVCKKFNVKTTECIAFEDSLTPIKTLKNLGIITYAVYDKWQEKRENEIKKISDFYIYDYNQLLKK